MVEHVDPTEGVCPVCGARGWTPPDDPEVLCFGCGAALWEVFGSLSCSECGECHVDSGGDECWAAVEASRHDLHAHDHRRSRPGAGR
jgi:hypothetical protein